MTDWVRVASTNEVRPGERLIVELEDRNVALFHVDGEYYCIADVCTHDGGPVAEGELDGYEIECPRHGARFDIRTGAVLSFPAVVPVPSYEVKVEGPDIYLLV